ncbi:MAG TPA: GNAT family N-acetyltransferase [Anaerolineales bacterium]
MIMEPAITILDYSPEHRSSIRSILTKIGWAEQYISGMENAADVFSKDKENYGMYLAVSNGNAVGYLYVQYYAWNQLCQIQGLAVHPEFQRQGAASALVAHAEAFARSKHARGIYVDTPTTNTGGRRFYEAIGYQLGYIMPRYYEDGLDGVTYQKFFNGV